ncbi:MAG: PAS domain S-box protein [Candidatus Eisenbacteria bacterium]|nr:PAS domain S-box protein [Candidatus Eisenbacteria bacterium]
MPGPFHTPAGFLPFLCALGSVSIGALALDRRRSDASLPWSMLGAFGLAHAAMFWCATASLGVGGRPAAVLADFAALASLLALAEFTRVAGGARWPRVPGRWALAAVSAVWVWARFAGAPPLASLLLSLVCVGAAGLVLRAIALGGPDPFGRLLRYFALGIFAHAFFGTTDHAIGQMSAAFSLAPATLAARALGIAIPLIVAIAGLVAATTLGMYAFCREELVPGSGLRAVRARMLAGCVFATVSTAGLGFAITGFSLRASGAGALLLHGAIPGVLGLQFLMLRGLMNTWQGLLARAGRNRFENECLLSAVVETAGDALLVVDEEGRPVASNASFLDMTGLTPETLRQMDEPALLAAFRRQLVSPEEFASMREVPGSSQESLHLVRLKDGRVLRCSSRPLPEGGILKGRVWVWSDVTARTESERERRERNARLERQSEALLQLAESQEELYRDRPSGLRRITQVAAHTLHVEQVGVWLYDKESDAVANVWRYERSAGRHTEAPNERAHEEPAHFDALRSEGTLAIGDVRHDSRTRGFWGDHHTAQGSVAVLHAPIRVRGAIVGLMSFGQTGPVRAWTIDEQIFAGCMADCVANILESEERKRVEQGLQRAQRFHQQVIETAVTPFFMTDDDGRIRAVNDAFCAATGFYPEEIIGRHHTALAQERCGADCPLADPNLARRVARHRCGIDTKDGRQLEILLNISAVEDAAGLVQGRLFSFVDLTEAQAARRETDTVLRETEATRDMARVHRERREQLERDLDAARERVAQLEKEAHEAAASRQREREAQAQERAAQSRECDAGKRELEARARECDALQAKLASVEKEARAQADELRRKVEGAERRSASLVTELERTRNDAARTQSESERTAARVREVEQQREEERARFQGEKEEAWEERRRELEAARAAFAAEMGEAREEFATQMRNANEEHAAQLRAVEERCAAQVRECQEQCAAQVRAVREEARASAEQQRAVAEQARASLGEGRRAVAQRIVALRKRTREALAQARKSEAEAAARAQRKLEERAAELAREASERNSQVEREAEERVERIRREADRKVTGLLEEQAEGRSRSVREWQRRCVDFERQAGEEAEKRTRVEQQVVALNDKLREMDARMEAEAARSKADAETIARLEREARERIEQMDTRMRERIEHAQEEAERRIAEEKRQADLRIAQEKRDADWRIQQAEEEARQRIAEVREQAGRREEQAQARGQAQAQGKGQAQALAAELDAARRRMSELAEEVRASQAAKGRFLANLSHGIRHPMNAIVGMTERALSGRLSADQRKQLEAAQSSARALLVLLDDLFDLSRVAAGHLELEPVEFDLRSVVMSALDPFVARAAEKEIVFNWCFSSEIPDVLIGDPARLRQALMNVVGNAFQFTEKGRIEVGVAPVPESDDSLGLLFTVKDTGIGIPQQRLQALLDPAHAVTTSPGEPGTGLGLAITGELVKMMGGRLWAESREGSGSTFHFTARMRLGGCGSCAADAGKALSDRNASLERPDPPAIDLDELIRDAGGRRAARERLDAFFKESPRMLARVRQALLGKNAIALGVAVHLLKGAAGNLSAENVRRAAEALESHARKGDIEGARRLAKALEEEICRLRDAAQHLDKAA